MRILFTGIGRRVELIQAFRNAALVLNKDLKIYGADMSGTAPALAFCDYTCKVVSMRDPNYIDNLLQLCKDNQIDLLIPTIDTDLVVLSENRERFQFLGTKVMISSLEMIRICRNKNLTSDFFINCSLHAPVPVNNWMCYKSGYPAFIKPKDGSSSIDAYRVEDESELKYYADQIKDYVIQPFIEGKEYTIDVFCDWEGNPIWIVPRERLQIRAGEVLQARICMDRHMIEETKKICSVFKPCGAITIQLIRDQEGIDWFIEINPRYGGGAPLSMKAGARSAESILKLLSFEKIEYLEETKIADNAIYSRFDQSVCIQECNEDIQGIIFDLDDTLYSEKEYVSSGYKAIAVYLGNIAYAEKLWAYFESGKKAVDELLIELGRVSEKDKILSVYRSHEPELRLYDGVEELLLRLKQEGKKIGIITDGRPEGQRKKITALGLDKLVDDIIITDALGGAQFRKPCDIAFRILQTKWKLPPSELIYIGDNALKDFQAPRQLGMKTLWFRNIDGLYFNEAIEDNYVSSVQEMDNALK